MGMARPRPGGIQLSPLQQRNQQLTAEYLRTGTVPEGFKVIESAPRGRTRTGTIDLGPPQPRVVSDPSWWDEWKFPILMAGGVLGGAYAIPALAGGGSAAGGLGVTSGVPSGLGGVGATGIGAGGAAVGGGLSPLATAGINAGINAGTTAARGGSWKDILVSGATGAVTPGGVGGQMSWTDLLTDPNVWGAVAQVAGQAAGSRSDQRQVETQQTNQANLADLALYTAAQNAQNQSGQLDLNRKGFSEQARGGRAKQALLADLISNLQDVAINVPGVQTASVTGGLRPSAIGATGRQGAAELGKQALAKLLEGDTFTGGELLPTPEYRPMPQRGGVETALDWIGLLGAGAGAVGSFLPKNQEPGTYSQLPSAQQPDAVLRNQRNVRF